MLQAFEKFWDDDSGAVTVDWVVLCAGVVTMAVVVFTEMETGAVGLADGISTYLTSWSF